jgi:hypothetical protein
LVDKLNGKEAGMTEEQLEEAYRKAANENFGSGGDLEFDADAVVSIGDDPGAYVQCWKWVPEEYIKKEES